MPKIKSIEQFIGSKFGQWTLLYDYGRIDRKRLVKVKCVCGYERKIDFGEIKRGKSTNCGCQCRSDVKDFIGKKLNKLTILESLGVLKNKTRVKCLCECGKEVVCRFDSLINGSTKACGCFNVESNTIHGLSKHPLFKTWLSVRRRCYDRNTKAYKNYGGRGVKICNEWRDDFKAFYDWAITNGWQKGLHLDKDIKGNGLLYSPDTCCFVTPKINSRHKRTTVYVNFMGEKICLSELAEKIKMPCVLLRNRIGLGWSVERAVTEPLNKQFSKIYRKCI